MNKKKKILIIIIIVFAIFVVSIIPAFINEDLDYKLSTSAKMISALTSIITSIFAILLYNKYGVDKTLINKQTDIVFSLITELKQLNFWILYNSSKGEANIRLSIDNLSSKYLSNFENEKLLFGNFYIKNIEKVQLLLNDVFLPIEIANASRDIQIQYIKGEKNKNNFMLVGVIEKSDNDFFGKINDKDITLKEFINIWLKILDTSKEWLNKHSDYNIELNFEKNRL